MPAVKSVRGPNTTPPGVPSRGGVSSSENQWHRALPAREAHRALRCLQSIRAQSHSHSRMADQPSPASPDGHANSFSPRFLQKLQLIWRIPNAHHMSLLFCPGTKACRGASTLQQVGPSGRGDHLPAAQGKRLFGKSFFFFFFTTQAQLGVNSSLITSCLVDVFV